MTIPSIKIEESRTSDAGAMASTGPDAGLDMGPDSFASFLGNEAGGSIGTQVTIPAASVAADAVPAHSGTGSSKGAIAISENGVIRPTAPDLRDLAVRGRSTGVLHTDDGARKSAVAETKNAGFGKGRIETGVGSKRTTDAPAGQSTTDNASTTVVVPVANDAVMTMPIQAGPAPLTQKLDLLDVPTRDQISGQETSTAVEEAGVGVDDGPIADRQVAEAVTPVTQPLESHTSPAGVDQNVQPQPDVWSDMVQAALPQAAPKGFPQKNVHVLPVAADKSSRPADSNATTLESLPVMEPTQGDANQLSHDALDGSLVQPLTGDADRGVQSSANPDAVSINGVALKKGDVHEERGGLSVSSLAKQADGTAISATSTYGAAPSRQFGTSVIEGDRRQGHIGTSALSDSEQFAIERRQTLGAARALGDALQSTAGLGVQTESFGRVTIHTATEGNHLLAQVTLEDGRQSAALVSHVPAVEQRLAQQLGLQAAVSVSTGTDTASGGLPGDDETPRQRRGAAEGKVERGEAGLASVESVEVRNPLYGGTAAAAGRIDITV